MTENVTSTIENILSGQSLSEKIIEHLVERVIEKIGFVLIDLLAPNAIDLASNLFLALYDKLEKLSEYIHDTLPSQIDAPESQYLLSDKAFNAEFSGLDSTD